MGRVLKKEDYKKFLQLLKSKAELVAPITTDMTRFEVVEDIDDINLEGGNPFFPIKKYFLPNKETLLKIKNGNTKVIEKKPKKRIIFGARLCDINGIAILDKLFLDHKYPDENYKKKRENTIIIGVNCLTSPSEYCFCGSMDLKKEAYDLLLHEREKDYYIDVHTDYGAMLVKHLPEDRFDYPLPKTEKKLDKKNLWPFFADKYWEKDNDLCVSCQRCTILCPTCFCFDMYDRVNPKTGDGERLRKIDSCHSKDFTEVAGGHVFRDTRLKRYRHRVLHKVQFFEDKFDRSMCTGCGRCIEYCHSKIDFVTTINKFIEH
ncbi:MAG: 4Fe-4S dicluster domain-containing protein [Nanoarchaeota archaeon]|nr:4Fe-4S dicluster domain-containing protein [DPANN group archaeon]MBL7116233.1 4Fe-4S dicluster domain-containing protein [Nanoarchaeota archaeon]